MNISRSCVGGEKRKRPEVQFEVKAKGGDLDTEPPEFALTHREVSGGDSFVTRLLRLLLLLLVIRGKFFQS